jgi:hypothetical protein
MFAEVLNLVFWFSALVLISYLLDRLWAYSLWSWVYIVFAAPGIIIHELSHWAACKITFTEVFKVKLISKQGGSVTHGPAKGGIFGQVFISMAPFIGIPLVLVLIGILFDWVPFFNCDLTWSAELNGNVGEMVLGTLESAWNLIKTNLWDNGSPWFLLYLYIAASLTTAMAPSKQDFVNSIVGLLVLFGIVGGWAIFLDLVIPGWDAPVATFFVDLFGWIIAVGMVMCLFGVILGLPFFIAKKISQMEPDKNKPKNKPKKKQKPKKKKDKGKKTDKGKPEENEESVDGEEEEV